MNIKIIAILVFIILLLIAFPVSAANICEAVQTGDLAKVKELVLTDKSCLNTKTDEGQTPLHLAVQTGNLPIVEFLVGQGANINAQDNQGNTPLHTAVASKQIEGAKYLLNKGVDVKLRNNEDMPAIALAMMSGVKELVEPILDAGQEINESFEGDMQLIHLAAILGDIEMTKTLISRGADVNHEAENSITPMYVAVVKGDSDLAEFILSQGIDKGYREKPTGRSLLHLATLQGIGQLVKLFIDDGYDVNAKDNSGRTPLQYAAKYGHNEIADLLVRNGARAKKLERDHGTPFLSQKSIPEGEAALWYLGTSGWAIKTESKLLLFDYSFPGKKPDEPSLANGFIDPQQIKDQNTYVFITHEHGDHFYSGVFDWKDTVDNITYILGFQPEEAPEAVYFNPRERKTVDDIEITTIASTDAGVGFLVRVDGLTIFHAGDHACKEKELNEPFTAEIDYLAEMNTAVDIAFMPITGCGFRDPDAVQKGIDYALDKLQPKVMLPMHVTGFEYQYAEFVQKAEKKKLDVKFDCAENRGDTFYYAAGKLVK